MSSRDTKIRTLKVLAREDRDGGGERGGGREDRDGRRDRDRGDRRKDERERDKRRERERDGGEGQSKPVQGPIVLLKRPDAKPSSIGGSGGGAGSGGSDRMGDSSTTSGGGSLSGTGGENSKSAGPTLILQRSSKKDLDNGEQERNKLSGPPPPTDFLKAPYRFPGGQALKLIDSSMKMCPWKSFDYDGNNYPGNMDYLVITAIGRPNVGKSTILSYLAGNEKFGSRHLFPARSREEEMQSSVYISSDQIVYIEMSSVYNQAATNELIPLVSQQGVLEVSNVTWNLRLVRWALSVSHIILVVSENIFEPAVFQLMNSAEIIHSMDSALGEGAYPELVYVCNKSDLELIDKSDELDEFRNHFTSITGRTPRITSNYFVLPHVKYESEHDRFCEFKNSILEFNRLNRAPFAPDKEGLTKLTQKHNIQEWYQNATRLWEDMNLPNYFSSYVKLLP